MRVELLYFEGCPNWQAELDELNDVLQQYGRPEHVDLVEVTSGEAAEALRFPGSPTVRIDGHDVEPDAPETGFNLECRIYWVDGRARGRPSRAWVIEAIQASGGGDGA